jgi:predicted N-acyltransferase
MNLNHPMMISHSLYGQYSQVLSIEDRRIVIKFILDAIHNISILQDVPIYGFPMIHESDKILLEETKQTNFVTKYFNSVCRLYIHWENFDEYLHSFNNKKRRKISKLIRECEKQGLTCKNDISIDEIAQLAKKTCSHHDSPLFYSKSFLECIFKEMKQYIKIFSANYENRSIGVLVCFSFNSVLTPWLVGLDYDLSKELNPYNYLYVKIIEFSINNQIKLIEFGRGTFYIKSKYGCEMEKLFISLKGTSESLDQLVEMWCNEIERSSLDYLNKYKIKYNKSMTRTA